ncbi:MAG: AraC family transcriptional regulator [Peptococcaceae bacterium]|jgi:phage FluMu protein Com|nr:AraC family transcriptional regulator [Peptococcaceae bacterium]
MSDLKARVAYLQGLSDGLEIRADSKEGKLLQGIIDVLGDFAETVEGLKQGQENLEDYIESIDEDLYHLEEGYSDGDHCREEDEYIEVTCPACNEIVCFDAEIVDDDDIIEVTCPNCDAVVFVNDDEGELEEMPESRRLSGDNKGAEEEDI